jgi:hypothetical protein
MIKYKNITYPVITETECAIAQSIAFQLGYSWEVTGQTIMQVEPLKWLKFKPDEKLIYVCDQANATNKEYTQAVTLSTDLMDLLRKPPVYTPKPLPVYTPKPLPVVRPFSVATFLYPKSNNADVITDRYIRVQSLDEDYLIGYEIKHPHDDDNGVFKKFLVDKMLSDVIMLYQDVI